MASKLDEMIRSMSGNREMFEPSEFDDPVAMQTDWTPTKRGGTNFRSHKLAESNSERFEFRLTTGAKLLYLIFLVVGFVVVVAYFCKVLFGGWQVDGDNLCLLGFGLVIMIVGGSVLYFCSAPIVFDRRRGFFWIGRKNPEHVFNKGTLKHFAELEQIHALQLISKLVVTGSQLDYSRYFSYELNLVLEDGKRINVLSQGDQDSLREDAETLAAFLDKPIWDAT